MKVLFLCLLLLCQPLAAQEESPAPAPPAGQQADAAAQAGTLSEERLRQLIETLESDTARAGFLANLETLLDTEAAAPAPTAFRELVDFTAAGDNVFARFIAFLNGIGLSDSTISRLLALLVLGLAIVVLVALNTRLARLLNGALDSVRDRLHLSKERFALYFRTQLAAGYIAGVLALLYGINQLFGFWLTGFSAGGLVNAVFTFLVIFLLFVTVWEGVNGLMEFSLGSTRLSRSRQQTLMSVLRNFFLVILVVLLGLVVLSELGIDIVPLLAGAGIVGVALGFGAQAMVKDFLNGFTVIFEDLFQVGDVIDIGGRAGVVEKITLRKVQLRNLEGVVHTVPFGEVLIVDNLTKDYAYFVLDVQVAYREDVDAVIACLCEVDEELRRDEAFAARIRAPLEILGVENFLDSAVLIRARSMTGSHDRWAVGREFRRRVKLAFDERGIEIPFPHQTIYFGADKQGKAPPVHVELGKTGPNPRSGGLED